MRSGWTTERGRPERAQACAEMLGLPFAVSDMRLIFEREVTSPFVESYLKGYTPNPCVLCNPRVKFRALFDYAAKYDCDFVATGHYARAEDGFLFCGTGPHDQSYMLYRLPREWVTRCVFPLGAFSSKEDVRAVAGEFLPPETSRAAASMDICFIPDGVTLAVYRVTWNPIAGGRVCRRRRPCAGYAPWYSPLYSWDAAPTRHCDG